MKLYPHQVPDFPETNHWPDILRWCVMVMNEDCHEYHAMTQLLAKCLAQEGLSRGEVSIAERILDLIQLDFEIGLLECQATPYVDLNSVEMGGHA
ncbi:MAG: hypothetical protein M3H12_13835 [Chromatiales bacterium]|nr:hypothetical protein [Gammaproteobacteria bacterium]